MLVARIPFLFLLKLFSAEYALLNKQDMMDEREKLINEYRAKVNEHMEVESK